jgi:YegS/Rv2252/BmrU family lipid kinase
MLKTRVIFNPRANRSHNAALAYDLRQLADAYGGVDWVMTESPGHGTHLAIEAGRLGYERVVALGGDGTIQEVVNGLMQLDAAMRPALGIVPVGSGNDFVKGIGVAQDATATLAFRRVVSGEHVRIIDVGYARLGDRPERYWVNVLGIGFDAAVTLQSQRTNLRGFSMYFVATLRTIIENYEAPQMDIDIDGERWSQRIQMLTIGNGTREGGGFITTPAAQVDDGLLHYTMFSPVSRPMMVRLIPEVMRGTHERFAQVRMGTLKSIHLHADRALLIHTDGEMIATYPDHVLEVEAGVIAGAIRLVS